MLFHPRPDDQGHRVPIKIPDTPTDQASWTDPDRIATIVPAGPMPESLNSIPLRPWEDMPRGRPGWSSLPEALKSEPLFFPTKAPAAGVVILESDGRVWVVSPTNRFGGYVSTFPKGHQTEGLTLQQSAMKEAYEESGLRVLLVRHLVDVPRSTTHTRYYLAQRVGGHPGCMGWESQAVHLVPRPLLGTKVGNPKDHPILEALRDLPARRPWESVVRDFQGTARRVCFTIQGFAVTHGRWPTRLMVDPTTMKQIQDQLTRDGYDELLAKVEPVFHLRHTLAVEDSEGNAFDYNDEARCWHPSVLSTDPVTTWLWGVARPTLGENSE